MVVAIFVVLLFTVPAGMLCAKLCKYMRPDIPKAKRVFNSCLPFHNVLYARKIAYGRHPVFTVAAVLILLLCLFRVAALLLLQVYPVLIIYSAFGMIVAMGLIYIFMAAHAVDFARMLGASAFVTIICVILPPIGHYILSMTVGSCFMQNKEEVTDVFKTGDEA